MIRPPLISGNDHEKIEQIVRYLFILADELRKIQISLEEEKK